MRVIDKAPAGERLVSFEIEVEAGSETAARATVARYGPAKLQRPFTEALGVASDADVGLLARVAQLGRRGIVCTIDRVSGHAPRFTVALSAYPGPAH